VSHGPFLDAGAAELIPGAFLQYKLMFCKGLDQNEK
jgi:hypothetical protein